MTKLLSLLLAGVIAALAACASSTQQAAVQLPGAPATNGLQTPPDLNERPVQTAVAAAR
jgi:hypothetical protein